MTVGAYSHSSLALFSKCPLAYRLKKIDKKKTDEPDYLISGQAAHIAIDLYVRHCHKNRIVSDAGAIDPIIDALTLEKGKPVPEQIREEVRAILYTFAESYAVRLRAPSQEDQLSYSIDWSAVSWFSRNPPVRWRAKVDLLDYDPITKTAKVTDWKTGWKIPTKAEFEASPQLRIYAFMASLIFPDAEQFEISFFHARRGFEQGPITLTREEVEDVRHDLERQMMVIDETVDFVATPGEHCGTCDLRLHCPRYQESGRGEAIPESPTELAEEYFLAKARLKDLEGAVKKHLEDRGPIPLASGKALGYRNYEQWKVTDVKGAVADLLRSGIPQGIVWAKLSLSKTATKAMLKTVDETDRLEDFLEAFAEVKFTNRLGEVEA